MPGLGNRAGKRITLRSPLLAETAWFARGRGLRRPPIATGCPGLLAGHCEPPPRRARVRTLLLLGGDTISSYSIRRAVGRSRSRASSPTTCHAPPTAVSFVRLECTESRTDEICRSKAPPPTPFDEFTVRHSPGGVSLSSFVIVRILDSWHPPPPLDVEPYAGGLAATATLVDRMTGARVSATAVLRTRPQLSRRAGGVSTPSNVVRPDASNRMAWRDRPSADGTDALRGRSVSHVLAPRGRSCRGRTR